MKSARTVTIGLAVLLAATAAFASWYDDYDAGVAAAKNGQWNVVIQKMTAAIKGNAKENFRGALIVRCVFDLEGNMIFGAEDAAAVEDKNGTVINRLFTAARRVNRMGDDAAKDAEKNLPGGGSDSSSIGSPSPSAEPSESSASNSPAAS